MEEEVQREMEVSMAGGQGACCSCPEDDTAPHMKDAATGPSMGDSQQDTTTASSSTCAFSGACGPSSVAAAAADAGIDSCSRGCVAPDHKHTANCSHSGGADQADGSSSSRNVAAGTEPSSSTTVHHHSSSSCHGDNMGGQRSTTSSCPELEQLVQSSFLAPQELAAELRGAYTQLLAGHCLQLEQLQLRGAGGSHTRGAPVDTNTTTTNSSSSSSMPTPRPGLGGHSSSHTAGEVVLDLALP
jgi:hypothetical protein